MIFVYLFVTILIISILASLLGTLLRIIVEEQKLDWKQLSAECMEIAVSVYIILTYIPGWFPSRPTQNPNPKIVHPPILLVPGYSLNRMSMFFISIYLKRLGYEWVWCINHPVQKDDVQAFAKALDEKIRWFCHYTQSTEVTVIAHSMGGIVSNLAIQNHNSPIQNLITLGTPWKGTKLYMFGLGKHVLQLAPAHPIIQRMVVPTVRHLALWSRQDWILLPNENAIMDGLHHKEVSHIGHVSLLMHARTLPLIHQFLNEQKTATDSLCHR